MNIRDEIRIILNEMFNEAVPSPHFKDRVYGRLASTMYTKPQFNYSDVESQIEIINKINFQPFEAVAIHIRTFRDTFVSKDPVNDKESVGDELWVVVRGNEISTVFFRNSKQAGTPVFNADSRYKFFTLKFKTLFNYFNSAEKNPDGTVDLNMDKFTKQSAQGKGKRKKVELDFPIVELEGSDWYVDEKNEELIFAKNIKKRLSFDDLKEEFLEKVIDAVTVQNTV